MWECSDVDFLKQSGRASPCHLVNTHNAVIYEAFDTRLHLKVVTLIVSLPKEWTEIASTLCTKLPWAVIIHYPFLAAAGSFSREGGIQNSWPYPEL